MQKGSFVQAFPLLALILIGAALVAALIFQLFQREWVGNIMHILHEFPPIFILPWSTPPQSSIDLQSSATYRSHSGGKSFSDERVRMGLIIGVFLLAWLWPRSASMQDGETSSWTYFIDETRRLA